MLSTALCENREEPWPWFQHLRGNQWTGEPLQALGHGKTISLSVLKDRAQRSMLISAFRYHKLH